MVASLSLAVPVVVRSSRTGVTVTEWSRGFTITTEACREYLATGEAPPALRFEVTLAVRRLEDAVGRRLGDVHDPLLVSVRSGAKFSMPGMMDTVLDVGLNDLSVLALAEASGDERFAWDSYRRLVQMFARTVLDMEGSVFEDALEKAKRQKGVTSDLDLDSRDLQKLLEQFKALVAARSGREFPQIRASSWIWPLGLCSTRGTAPGRGSTVGVSASPMTSALRSTFAPWCSAT